MKTPRRTLAVSIVLVAALSGCGKDDTSTPGTAAAPPATATATATSDSTPSTPSEPTADATSDGPSVPAESPSQRPTPSETTMSAPPTQSGSNEQNKATGGSVPQKDPGDYGDAAVAAWSKGDVKTLTKYLSPSLRAKAPGAVPKGELLRAACEDDMCTYTTTDDKRVTLTFDLAKVKAGKEGGITGLKVG